MTQRFHSLLAPGLRLRLRVHGKALMKKLAIALVLTLSCSGCAVVSVAGTVVSTTASIAGTAVETGVSVTGSLVRGVASTVSTSAQKD